jgi:hypothetical protein
MPGRAHWEKRGHIKGAPYSGGLATEPPLSECSGLLRRYDQLFRYVLLIGAERRRSEHREDLLFVVVCADEAATFPKKNF